MRLGITALAAVVFTPVPATAFGFHLDGFIFTCRLLGTITTAITCVVGTRCGPGQMTSRSGGDSTAARGRYAAEQADREARAETNAEAFENCTGLAPGVTNLPIDQIRQTVHPTAHQEAALDNLSSASSQAGEIIKSSCPTSVPLTPIGRLDAAEQRLDTTIKAIRMVLLHRVVVRRPSCSPRRGVSPAMHL